VAVVILRTVEVLKLKFKIGIHCFSLSMEQALTRRRFLSRETGLPNKSLHVKKKNPLSLDGCIIPYLPTFDRSTNK
jgi:hypothetical protein